MTEIQNQEADQHQDQVRLIDLVPRDCRQAERLDLETKLQRLELSLNRWLREKIDAIESERSSASSGGARPHLPDVRGRGAIETSGGLIIGHGEEILMSTDDRDILEVLQAELGFIEQGGYGRSPRTPWKTKSPFQDSLTCINYTYLEKVHPCSECHLIDFVPGDRRSEEVPCHFIPLNESGQTLSQLGAEDDQHKLEEALKGWLRARIQEIEASRRATAVPTQVS